MRVAHLIMAHKNPGQLSRLVKKLMHPQFDIYVHLDAKTNIADFHEIQNISNVTLIQNRIECNWGGFSFVRAIFNSLAEIGATKHNYGFINLLSAQDYPIQPVAALYKFLNEHQGTNFISYEESKESDWWKHATQRYELYHLTDYNIKGKYMLQKFINRITPQRKFPYGIPVYGSSNSSWWTLTGACAAYITHQFETDPKLRRFLKLCWGSDEFTIATLVMNSPFKEKVYNNNMRYIDWSEGNAHPKLLVQQDLDKIMGATALFARKFDTAVDAEILNLIDQEILKQQNSLLKNSST